MSWRRELSKLFNLFRRRKFLDDMDEEIRCHLRMEEQASRESGLSTEDAYYAARKRFGNVTLAHEASRQMWGWTAVDALRQDLRYGLRQLRRKPGFATVAVFALVLGIGLNTAVVTIYKAMVARPIAGHDASELVNIALVRNSRTGDYLFSYPDYEAYRKSLHSLQGLIAFQADTLRLSDAGDNSRQYTAGAGSGVGLLGLPDTPFSNAEFASVYVVSENYFQVLGIAAVRGRTFDALGVSALATSPSVLISDNYWQRRFGGDPAVLGKTIRLNRAAVTVVGVTPHDFAGTDVAVPDFWLPISLEPLVHVDENWLHDRDNRQLRLVGRLAPGVRISNAQAEINVLADYLRGLHDPRSDAAKPATAIVWPGSPLPLPLKMYRGLTLTILLIMLAAGIVLVIACANVASLQLARARSRETELHTRLSLGASRQRLARQLLTESALLGLLSGFVALPFTWALLKVALVLAAENLPRSTALVLEVRPDLPIFAYVCAISLIAGILFGLAPAMESSRSGLSSGVRGGAAATRTRHLQDLLLTAQVALSLVLLIAATMLIRSSINALRMETGYETKRVVELAIQFPNGPEYRDSRKSAFMKELRTRLAALPRVAAITSGQPPDGNSFRTVALPLSSAGQSARRGSAILHFSYVQANYFQLLGIPLLVGRSFRTEAATPELSVILSESAARQLWPDENPVGHSLQLGPTDERSHNESELTANGPTYQIIGVVRDTRGVEFDGSDSRKVYLPLAESGLPNHPILIRSQADGAQVIKAINPVISSMDPDVTATSSTLEETLRFSAPFIGSRMAGALASVVGFFGLLLALIGIHGTVNYIVALRTREVGIRMAVGAQKRDVLRLILWESARPVLTGLVAGTVLAVGASYLLRGVLYGLHSIDGISFGGMSLLFLAMALIAAYPPSRRAMHVDPVVALRYE